LKREKWRFLPAVPAASPAGLVARERLTLRHRTHKKTEIQRRRRRTDQPDGEYGLRGERQVLVLDAELEPLVPAAYILSVLPSASIPSRIVSVLFLGCVKGMEIRQDCIV
jgi:hypothetical protein